MTGDTASSVEKALERKLTDATEENARLRIKRRRAVELLWRNRNEKWRRRKEYYRTSHPDYQGW